MNKVMLSRSDLNKDFSEETTLGEVFGQIEKKLQGRGEIVCRFLVNGLTLTEEDEKKFAQFKLGEVDFIEVESETPTALLTAVLANWVDTLPGMIRKSDQLAQDIRVKGVENHMRDFVDLVDSCQFLVESLISLRSLCRDLPFVTSAQWRENEMVTAKAIAEALNIFERKDFVLLADIMEYDLGHCLQSWLDALMELKQNVHQTASHTLGR